MPRSAYCLRLRHLDLPSDGERQVHTAGWELYTGKLGNLVASS
ncbi:MAG TPA: hypothetical protein VFR68_09825 [Candidatus Dormibacteraeota bacterium]|nr:hypothetical protein [Candidatus Dormibacteraeota bacterium]